MAKKKGASRQRRCQELLAAAAELRASQPGLAQKLSNQAGGLSTKFDADFMGKKEIVPFFGDAKARRREEIMDAASALLPTNPSMAQLLFSQAASLVSPHNSQLRARISAMAGNARRRAEQARAASARDRNQWKRAETE